MIADRATNSAPDPSHTELQARQLGRLAGDPARVHFVALWRRDAAGVWRIAHLVGQVEADAAQAPR